MMVETDVASCRAWEFAHTANHVEKRMIAWDPSLSVGLEELDDQHRALIRLVNELSEKRAQGDDDAATKTLQFLRDYMNTHLAMETELMLDLDYPEREAHRQQHELFVNHVIFFEIEKEFGVVSSQMLDAILAFLNDWFLNHIATEDKALGAFVRAQAMSE